MLLFLSIILAAVVLMIWMGWRYDHSHRAKPFGGNHSAWSNHDSLGGGGGRP